MTLRLIPALLATLLCLGSCSDDIQLQQPIEQDEHIYSFSALLPDSGTRMSYQEDSQSHNLKMVWDEDDVIWLYPDESMGDSVERYKFVQNTGAGTAHTVFVHQGYIKNWEHWSGKAIYLFPDGENLDVVHNSEEFPAKAAVQKKNNDNEHLKYAEHILGSDGSKQYTEYWADMLVDANLKHDHQLTFAHRHTVVYKVMLRGFIFDIPGGSQLKMSGDAWGGEETILTLGSKEDKEPFLKVGEYGQANYQDNVLTAYIIRQVDGDVDGNIKKGEKLKFELFTYDELDGSVMELDPEDTLRNGNPEYPENYFTNLPWGEEYTWEVTATADIDYKAGDYVVADLTDTSKDYAYPKVAVDLGLPLKWAAFNLGAKKIDDYGGYVIWGRNDLYGGAGSTMQNIYGSEWTSGDPEHDAASFHWGKEWRTPTFREFLDLAHYALWLDSNGDEAEGTGDRWNYNLIKDDRIYIYKSNPIRYINGVEMALVKSKVNNKYIYLQMAGNIQGGSTQLHGQQRAYYNTASSRVSLPMIMSIYKSSHGTTYDLEYTNNYISDNNILEQLGVPVRAVKD